MKRLVVIIVSALLGAVVLYGFYCRLTYIDEVAVSGKAYGIAIGASKEKAWDQLQASYQAEDLWIRENATDPVQSYYRKIELSQNEKERFLGSSLWRIYFRDAPFDFLEVVIDDGEVAKVYRHRQRCEGP